MELSTFQGLIGAVTPDPKSTTGPGSSTLVYKHLSFEVPGKAGSEPKRLVDDVSVKVKAGELLAIMVKMVPSVFYAAR